MRNSVRLPVLIGLAMPGLALVAVWLWSTRRARAQDSNHSNHTEMTRELQGVAEEFKNITQKRGTRIVTPKDIGCAKSEENSCSDVENSTQQNRSLSSAQELDASSISRVEYHDSVNEMIVEDEERHESSEKSNEESPEFSRNSQIRRINDKGNSNEPTGGMSHYSNSNANGSFQDSARASEQDRGCTPSPKASGHNTDGSDNIEYSSVRDETDVPSASQRRKNITRVDSKVLSSRSQSLDESSDVSSIDSKRGSPLGQKASSTTGSDCEPTQPEHDTAEEITWELQFPQALCGRLIGKKGKNVQKISKITGTKIRLIPQKESSESSQRLVALTGSPKQLALALKALREKFPGVPFTRLNGNQPYVEGGVASPTSSVACVVLPENELFQVFVTNIVDANHFHVQLYDHLIHTHLRQLDQQMYQFYGGLASAMMPQTISTGMYCAAVSPSGWWWRAQVVGLLMKPDEVEITWLDYGGRTTVHTTLLRQLRSDFLQLPFQAVECYLSNVVPNHGEPQFSMAACALLEQLTLNIILTARITGYTRDCPNLELYVPDQWTGQSLFVNREFVRRGYGRWSETEWSYGET